MGKLVVLSLEHFVFDEPCPRLLESATLSIRRRLVDPTPPSSRQLSDVLDVDAEPLPVLLAAVIAVPGRLEMVELDLEEFLGDFDFCELDRAVGGGRFQSAFLFVLLAAFEIIFCETQFHHAGFFGSLKEVDDSITLAFRLSFFQFAFEFAVQVPRDDIVRCPWSRPGFFWNWIKLFLGATAVIVACTAVAMSRCVGALLA